MRKKFFAETDFLLENLHLTDVFWKEMSVTEYTSRALMPDTYGPKGRRPTCFLSPSSPPPPFPNYKRGGERCRREGGKGVRP